MVRLLAPVFSTEAATPRAYVEIPPDACRVWQPPAIVHGCAENWLTAAVLCLGLGYAVSRAALADGDLGLALAPPCSQRVEHDDAKGYPRE
jgi:hypothetical protein